WTMISADPRAPNASARPRDLVRIAMEMVAEATQAFRTMMAQIARTGRRPVRPEPALPLEGVLVPVSAVSPFAARRRSRLRKGALNPRSETGPPITKGGKAETKAPEEPRKRWWQFGGAEPEERR